jgi:hypothetical protein
MPAFNIADNCRENEGRSLSMIFAAPATRLFFAGLAVVREEIDDLDAARFADCPPATAAALRTTGLIPHCPPMPPA